METKSSIILSSPNKAAVLKRLIMHGPSSRIELSHTLSMSKMSVTNYVNELIAEGVIFETGTASSGSGRKPVLLDVCSDYPLFVSVQITRFYISVGVVNCKGEFHNINMTPTDSSDTINSVKSKITILLDRVLTPDILSKTWAIGASSMGPVSCKEGVLYANERPFSDIKIPVKEMLESRYNLPVYVNNDLNVLVFAEKYFGNATDLETFAIVGSSVGLGCGVMVDGELFTGIGGLGTELGHITVEAQGEPCYCGNLGCLERYAAIPSIVRWLQHRHEEAGIACEYNNWQDFISGVYSKNELCLEAFDRLITYLGAGLVTLVNLFNPGWIFLGEYYAQDAQLIAEPLEQYIRDHQFFRKSINTRVVGSRFMGVSPLIGPAAFSMHMSLNSP